MCLEALKTTYFPTKLFNLLLYTSIVIEPYSDCENHDQKFLLPVCHCHLLKWKKKKKKKKKLII